MKLGIENGYPERTPIDEAFEPWEVSLPDYVPYGEPVTNSEKLGTGTVVDKLRRAGLEAASVDDVVELSRMGSEDVKTSRGVEFASKLNELRFPLGRTGLNGTGIFYEAGASRTSDMIILHKDDANLSVALVKTRGHWNTPGGFMDVSDADGLETAIRETFEETGFDTNKNDLLLPPALTLSEIKLSDRTTDHGWIEAQVYGVAVESRFNPKLGSDTDEVEDADWFKIEELPELVQQGSLSGAKLRYIHEYITQSSLLA